MRFARVHDPGHGSQIPIERVSWYVEPKRRLKLPITRKPWLGSRHLCIDIYCNTLYPIGHVIFCYFNLLYCCDEIKLSEKLAVSVVRAINLLLLSTKIKLFHRKSHLKHFPLTSKTRKRPQVLQKDENKKICIFFQQREPS